ncbi:hypothetical protein ACFP7A_04940 [Sporolactobacillus kofuensis]|uniref:CsbD family protein n=1 Tax=Sporolactobacillus kofuensis TaxID=269672 RepID=A0ABW1WBL2_9BACL|nr:hypothetical protein [Sporolactobacillus kofuensis]MCO7174809.1 hypothetical protein [Sporolactobacillus kofuensis]
MMIKKTGSFLGKAVGTITGEPIKWLGKKLNNEFVQDVGESASNTALELRSELICI